MSFNINIKRFIFTYPVLLLLLSMLQLFFHRIYMFPYYSQMSQVFYTGDDIAFFMLLLSSACHAFLFLTLYAQACATFPKLRGGLAFGLVVAMLMFLPVACYQMAAITSNSLKSILGRWLYFGLLANLMLGAIAGLFYGSADA